MHRSGTAGTAVANDSAGSGFPTAAPRCWGTEFRCKTCRNWLSRYAICLDIASIKINLATYQREPKIRRSSGSAWAWVLLTSCDGWQTLGKTRLYISFILNLIDQPSGLRMVTLKPFVWFWCQWLKDGGPNILNAQKMPTEPPLFGAARMMKRMLTWSCCMRSLNQCIPRPVSTHSC